MAAIEEELQVIIITTKYSGSEKKQFKVYPAAIKDAIMEYMVNHRYIPYKKEILNYYIELDRVEDMMVAVIEM